MNDNVLGQAAVTCVQAIAAHFQLVTQRCVSSLLAEPHGAFKHSPLVQGDHPVLLAVNLG